MFTNFIVQLLIVP